MRIIKSASYEKWAGKKERGKRDGTGPYEGSAQKSISDKGKRKERGEECPKKDEKDEKDKEAGYDKPGIRDGTGPYRKSRIREEQEEKGIKKDKVKGRRKQRGEECPF